MAKQGGRWARRVAAAGLAVAAACTNSSSPDEPDGAVYAAALSWLADQTGLAAEPDDRHVFVEGLDGPVPLETQAEVVRLLEDSANVRFIDEREEAVEDSDGEQVRNDGVLAGVGGIEAVDSSTKLHIEWYRRDGEEGAFELVVARRGGEWQVTESRPADRRPRPPGT